MRNCWRPTASAYKRSSSNRRRAFLCWIFGHSSGVKFEQPGQFAGQVFDAKVLHLLRPEYGIQRVTKVRAQTLEELAAKLGDVKVGG